MALIGTTCGLLTGRYMQFSMKNTISYSAVTNVRLVYDERGKQCRYQAQLSRKDIFCATWLHTKYHIYLLTIWAPSPPSTRRALLMFANQP